MTKEICADTKGAVGHILLSRPQNLNALNHYMIESLYKLLISWESDRRVSFVLIEGEGRAFCAGGDIRMFLEAYKAGTPELAEQFLHQEYDLNLLIHNYRKPYISLHNGITMGGGMGISIHGSHRVLTENVVMAMPESGIGFFPDIGARWFLNRAPGKIGLYLGLTALSVNYIDALYCGFGTHFVASKNINQLRDELLQSKVSDIESVLARYQEFPVDEGESLRSQKELIDSLFSAETIEGVFRNLSAHKSEFAQTTLGILRTRSPRSLRIIFETMNAAKGMSIEQVIADDKKICTKFTRDPELMEGIRAAVVDKDRSPKWTSEPIQY